jgi:hypothetical protein
MQLNQPPRKVPVVNPVVNPNGGGLKFFEKGGV